MKNLKIGKKNIGNNCPTFFVADIAANWDGSLNKAKDLIHLAAKAGADAAKFQNFNAKTIVSDFGFKQLNNGKQLSHQSKWKKSVFDVYSKASLPLEWTKILKKTCDEAGIEYFTSPYDLSQIDELSKFVAAWKIGSGDITWYELIKKLASDKKPLMVATGASTINEVSSVYKLISKSKKTFVVMQCNTNYTAELENLKYINLNVLKEYKKKFPRAILGLSDHTPGHSSVLGAVTLGARVIEKHFTNNTNLEGPDHKFSMDPKSWKEMVLRTRELENSLGKSLKKVEKNEYETLVLQRRSIRAKENLLKDHIIKKKDLIYLRPCPKGSLNPYQDKLIIGKKLKKNINKEDCILLKNVK